MNLNRGIALPLTLVAVTAAAALTATTVAAADEGQGRTLAQRLAGTFNLYERKVQAVLDADRADRKAAREERYASYLDQLARDGKITPSQKAALQAKHQELSRQIEQTRPATHQERRATMQWVRQDIETWARANSIDPRYLMLGRPGHHERGLEFRSNPDKPAPGPTTSPDIPAT